MKAKSVDPDQTAPMGAVWFGSTLIVEEASNAFQQTTKANDLWLVLKGLILNWLFS